jgi:predicted alpha/beta-hydrolase family hydrolase
MAPGDRRFKVSLGGGQRVTVVESGAPGSDLPLFVYAPGAGSSLDDPFGLWLARELVAAGGTLWRFQFPYMEAKRQAPDRAPVLEAAWKAVAKKAGPDAVLGGRSMGGRIASNVVASGTPCRGLALFAYPLRPPGRNQTVRDQHFGAIGVPTLFCSGTRDTFATPAQLETAGAGVGGARFHFLDGADHGFNVLKSSGRNREDVWREATDILVAFLRSLPPT